MTELRLASTFDPGRIPAQQAFRRSRAKIRGYGGGMGGGKSRALCEEAFDWALEYPGIHLPVIRQVHTSITDTTRKTFMEQTLPAELRERKDLVRVKESQGQDFIEFLWCGSQIHFIGLDNPTKLFSGEFGGAMFDEAHEISERDVLHVNHRLRQRCKACIDLGIADCAHMPRRMVFTFNPTSPNHWLNKWFRLAAEPTEYGFRRDHITPTDADEGDSIGDMEFLLALPTANPFLPPNYISQNLGGMSAPMKRRYLLGMWEHIDGTGYFDADALTLLHEHALTHPVLLKGEPSGDPSGKDKDMRPALVQRGNGRLEVYKAPVRTHVDRNGDEVKAHRYVVSADASSGASADWAAVQVIDVDELEQVAEWQGKVDPDQLAEVAFLIAAVYNGALLAVEVTGGWGLATMKRVVALIGGWQGGPESKPRIYTRKAITKLSDRFTDLIGWDTQTGSRAVMLSTLEEHVRDGSLQIHGQRTLAEMSAFSFPERMGGLIDYRKPQARTGEHDDLVMALGIGVYIAVKQPRQSRSLPVRAEAQVPSMSAAGF